MRQSGKVALNTLDQRLLVKTYVCDVLEAPIFLQSLSNFLYILCFNNFNSSYSDAFFSIAASVIYLITLPICTQMELNIHFFVSLITHFATFS